MPKGIVRRIDHMGRITIPIEMRRAIGAENDDNGRGPLLDMYMDNGKMYLKKTDTKNKTAYSRALDELGRWTIPKEIRDTMGFKDRQKLDMHIIGDYIEISKFGCEWCDNTDDLVKVKGHKICRKCAEEVAITVFGAAEEIPKGA